MSLSSQAAGLLLYTALLAVVPAGVVQAGGQGYVIGGGGVADSAGGRALSLFADLGLAENTWLSTALAQTQSGGGFGGFDTLYADGGLDHWFDPVGVRVAAAYWGDKDILDSVDLRASLYFRNDRGSLSLDYERRNFDFMFEPRRRGRTRTVEFQANGFGVATRVQANDRLSLYLGGMSYLYSRDIRLEPNIDVLRFLSSSRLSLINSLIDYRYNAGVEFAFGLRTIDLRFERWQTAVDQGRVNSIGVGFLTPVGDRSDMEFRFAYDKSDNFGGTISLSAYLYYFGGG